MLDSSLEPSNGAGDTPSSVTYDNPVGSIYGSHGHQVPYCLEIPAIVQFFGWDEGDGTVAKMLFVPRRDVLRGLVRLESVWTESGAGAQYDDQLCGGCRERRHWHRFERRVRPI